MTARKKMARKRLMPKSSRKTRKQIMDVANSIIQSPARSQSSHGPSIQQSNATLPDQSSSSSMDVEVDDNDMDVDMVLSLIHI